MTFAVIVQARVGSTRLPGKVLESLGTKTALLRCLDRCARIPGVDAVVAAVPDTPENEPVVAETKRGGYEVARGSNDDVLSRYAVAARQVRATYVMRVTSDCPFIDPVVCSDVIAAYRAYGVDYACNNMPPRFPHGLDCEFFPAEFLYRAESQATLPFEREHVTPWLRTNASLKKLCLLGPGGEVARQRWTLDYPEDLAFFKAVYAEMGEAAASASWQDIYACVQKNPAVAAINAHKIDEARLLSEARADVEVVDK